MFLLIRDAAYNSMENKAMAFANKVTDAFKKLAKQDVSEDEIKELEEKIQKSTDKYIKEVDAAVDAKSKEIMTV